MLLSVKWPEQFPIGAYAWTPDSRQLVFVQRSGRQSEVPEIPAEDGKPRRTGIRMNGIRFLRLHPDGKRMAFQAGQTDREVWVV